MSVIFPVLRDPFILCAMYPLGLIEGLKSNNFSPHRVKSSLCRIDHFNARLMYLILAIGGHLSAGWSTFNILEKGLYRLLHFGMFWSLWYPSSLIDCSRVHVVTKLWAYGHSLQRFGPFGSRARWSIVHGFTWSRNFEPVITLYSTKWGFLVFAWKGALDGCFILTCSDLCLPVPVHVSQVPARQGVVIRDFCLSYVRGSSGSLVSEFPFHLYLVWILLFILGLLHSTAVVTHPGVCFLKYPMHLCFVWILCFTSI